MTPTRRDVFGLTAAMVVGASGFALVPAASRDRSAALPATQDTGALQVSRDTSLSDARDVARLAPFRANRTAALLEYEPGSPEPTAPPPALERPTWRLTGVLFGSPAVAVFEGFQDNAPRLLASGDSVEAYLVAAISGDSVVVEGRGTRWKFTVEAPWR